MPAPPEPPPRGWPPGFGASDAERDALLVIARREPNPRRLHELVWATGSAVGALELIRSEASTPHQRGALAVGPRDVRRQLARCGARLVTPADAAYPDALLDLPDPPAWLFARGAEEPPDRARVAVVGSRRCSTYGREMASLIGRGVAAAGIPVVSGAARGIDGAAHRGALAAAGPTVAVLGSGIDVAYPRSHERLLAEIASAGTVVSEYPPGTPAGRHRFPARNRIVAALARAIVVVEGAADSGSLITAELAQDLGRDVAAVPGPATSPVSAAPLELIRDGGALVRGPADVLELVGVRGDRQDLAAMSLSRREQQVLSGVSGPPTTLDAVAAAIGRPPAEVLAALASLEIKGFVRADAGRYQRTAAAATAG